MNIRDNEATQLQGVNNESTQLQGVNDEATQFQTGSDEATQLADNKESLAKSENSKNNNTPSPSDKEGKGKAKTAKKVAAFSGAGVLLGTAASYFSNMKAANSGTPLHEEETDEVETEEEGVPLPEADIQEAADLSDDIVNDEMTFEEAFTTAREALGAGSAFEWRGNVYATYTKEEWVDMTDEEKSDFYIGLNMENPYDASEEGNEVQVEISEPDPSESFETQTPETTESEEGDSEGLEIVSEGTAEEEEEVQVFVADDDEEDGANPDGEDVFVIDVDGDMTYDVLWTDSNHDGVIDEDEVIDIQDIGLTVNDLEEMTGTSEDLAANTEAPDYFSDALNDDIIV